MEAISVRELLEAVGGTLIGPEADLEKTISRVDTDSRNIHPGSLFIPLVGEGAEQVFLDVMPHCVSTRWHPEGVDIIPAGDGKAAGIRATLDRYGLGMEEIIAFGDGINDRSMLAMAGVSVAMGNASPAVQSQADWVTAPAGQGGIARALALNPAFIVCDEPVSALDVSIQAQIINLLKQLQKDFGFTYLFISHDLSVVEHISDTVGVMYLGSMVEYADTDKIFAHPLHPYTEALFSAIPIPDPDVKMKRIILKGSLPSPANPPAGCKFHTRCHKCMEVCKYAVPEWTQVEPEHWCACHLYNDAERAGRAEAAMAQAKSGAKPKVEKDEEKKAV